ncbi:aldose epimerase family protein [Zongyangia hominis]|uniref:Aldose 1-epimerase n=1 Tax=Zongyangia hominis TaxID=2763677 RepID=A0A926EF84_9FIRM|nr:aldose epimerase family protein [Zongyangia hominis]MBC8571074.1 galactose mutarotase [Zongyangia hominis]
MTKIMSREFGVTKDGQSVKAFTLANGQIQAEILEYGCTVQSLFVKDREGEEVNVVLSLPSVEAYEEQTAYLGCVVGRYGNRVRDGRFVLDGKSWQLTQNDGKNHLHGGKEGFHRKVWQGQIDGEVLRLRYTSPGGEEGYPGQLSAIVSYSLTGSGLRIEYEAMTDRPTIVNLTNHSFFHLAGGRGGDVTGHQVQVFADKFLQIDGTGMPDGYFAPVEGTPLDLREKKTVGEVLEQKDRLLDTVGGIDHCYAFEGASDAPKAALICPSSGIAMRVYSDCEGMQVYSGNFLDGSDIDRYGKALIKRSGICFEPQRFPDSINQPAFPDPILRPGEIYHQFTVYEFGLVE